MNTHNIYSLNSDSLLLTLKHIIIVVMLMKKLPSTTTNMCMQCFISIYLTYFTVWRYLITYVCMVPGRYYRQFISNDLRSTVKAANRKFIRFMSCENITFLYSAFQFWAWPLLDKRSTSKKYVFGLTDSIYKLVTWCIGHVVLVNNPIVLTSHIIYDSSSA